MVLFGGVDFFYLNLLNQFIPFEITYGLTNNSKSNGK